MAEAKPVRVVVTGVAGRMGGVLVGAVQGAAARAGIRPGDVILAVNQQNVKSVEQFREAMGRVEKGGTVALLVRRGSNSLYVPFRADAN